MTTGAVTRSPTLVPVTGRRPDADALTSLLERARFRVLRFTVLIGLLIALGNVVGAIFSFTPSGEVTGPATALAVSWCALWALAAAFPRGAARCLESSWTCALVLAAANAATVAWTGGINSPVLAVCMYVGWIASVVLSARVALVMSLMITLSLLAGYLLAGASIADVFGGPYRYGAVTNAVLPMLAGVVGVLLAAVTNATFSRLAQTLYGLRDGMAATTPALTALLADRLALAAPADRAPRQRTSVGAPLTEAEREVVALLADGHTPKQIALLRGVKLDTVRSQIKAAKRKTGARTINDLAAENPAATE